MSVLITGIEMPKDKAVSLIICSNGKVYYEYLEVAGTAIPVPPHGRLIDADALADDLDYDVENDQRVLDEMDFVGKERERVQLDKDCKQNCLWYLSNASTIIPSDKGGEEE